MRRLFRFLVSSFGLTTSSGSKVYAAKVGESPQDYQMGSTSPSLQRDAEKVKYVYVLATGFQMHELKALLLFETESSRTTCSSTFISDYASENMLNCCFVSSQS